MIWALAGAMSVAAAVAAHPAPPDRVPTAARYRSAADAVGVVLGSKPVVVAFGELHQTKGTAGIPSALRRFTEDILPGLAGAVSHLVVETWITTGQCGEAEQAVTKDVEKTTERPASTESEIERLIRQADVAGIVPRILSITCADYQAMRPAGQAVDYDKTLRITARALENAALRALRDRRRLDVVASMGAPPSPNAAASTGSPVSGAAARAFLAVYGGALHNDLHPDPELAPYTFAPGILAATLGRYVEIDLVVPEYAAGSAPTRAQAWWRVYQRARRPGATIMVRRSARSFVIVFPARARAR